MDGANGLTLGKWGRGFASLLIVVQLWGILGRPLEFATQGPTGPSPAAAVFYGPIRKYSEFAYLNHGYAFFAPNPGPSHLIGAQIADAAAEGIEQRYPDLRIHQPRLLYHRHFMLAEFLHNTYQPPSLPPEAQRDPLLRSRWEVDRKRHEAIFQSMRSHVAAAEGVAVDKVRLRRWEHGLMGLPEFLAQRRSLDDPRLWIDLTAAEQFAAEPLGGLEIPRVQWPAVAVPPGGER